MINGFSKKNEKDFVSKIDYILTSDRSVTILNLLQKYAEDLVGKTDIVKIINSDKEKKYVMAYALIKGQSQMVNRLLDYGYKLNKEEISLLLSHPVKEKLDPKYSYLLEEENDELAILVKGFEKNLFRKLKTNLKNLKSFLDNLNEEKKEYLFSYYEQFQETSMTLYRSDVSSVEVNDNNISAIDFCLFNKHYDYIQVLIEHNFPFSREQIYKIGSFVNLFSDLKESPFLGDSHELQKSYLDFLERLPDNIIKTIFLKNSSNNIDCAYNIADYFSQHILSKITLNNSDLDVILKSEHCNMVLLDKIIKDNSDYFFNKKTMLNFLKNNISHISGPFMYCGYNEEYKSAPDVFINIIVYILKHEPEYMKEFKELTDNELLKQIIFSQHEKQIVSSGIEQTEVDKVRIRRRI